MIESDKALEGSWQNLDRKFEEFKSLQSHYKRNS